MKKYVVNLSLVTTHNVPGAGILFIDTVSQLRQITDIVSITRVVEFIPGMLFSGRFHQLGLKQISWTLGKFTPLIVYTYTGS